MANHIWGNGMEYENPLVVTVDNKVVYQTVIGGEFCASATATGNTSGTAITASRRRIVRT